MKYLRRLLGSLSLLAINSLSYYSNNNNKRNIMSAMASTYKGIRGDGNDGNGITILPQDNKYENVVVFMHGLGDTADGWASLMPELQLKNTKFILPTASSRPITINGGYSMPGWSDIYGLDMESDEDRNGFNESGRRIEKLIDAEIQKGINSNKIIVGGFSQGGALALHVGLRYKHQLGGIVALSTWLPLRNDYPAALSDGGKIVPIFQVHGTDDMVVNFQWGKSTNDLIKTFSTTNPPQFLSIPGMGHSSDPDEIKALKEFLISKLN